MPDLNRSLLSEGENADTLGGLTDVTLTAPEEFQGLVYNGTGWVNQHVPLTSYVQNAEANTLTTGTVVYLFGGTGDHASVKRADYTTDTTSAKTIGVVGANIAASQNGPVITRGYVDGIDLSVGYSVGDVLWLGTNGQFTKTKAVAPNHLVFIGVVVRATNNGIIYVATQNGYELDELHNVAISNTVAAGEFLKFNGTLWVNDIIDLGTDTNGNYVGSVAAGTGISVSNTGVEGGTFTVTNDGVTSITGTANQITASASTGSVTLSLPANVTISNNLTVTGDLTVNGNTTTLNTANLNVEDNFILLNSGVTGSPSLNAGLEVERGDSTNVAIRWNESTDKWEFTVDGTNYTELGAGGASVSSSAPASPTTGALWFDSDDGKTYIYYDSFWVEIGGNPLGVIASDTAPTNPIGGQIWFNSANAGTYIYYDSQWIEIGATGLGAIVSDTAPTSPLTGQIWYNSSDSGTYVYYDSYWVEIGAAPYNTLISTIDAKGDLLVGTANDTISRLAVGTNGQYLSANSSTATGLEWKTVDALPSQTGNGGKYLTTNGNTASWANVSTDVMTDTKNAALLIMDIGA